MNLICKKLEYSLNQNTKISKNVFELIKKNIPNTFFSILNFSFFSLVVQKKIIDVFYIKKKNKLVSILTFVKAKNLKNFKKYIFIFLLTNPFTFFSNLIFILKSISRTSVDLFDRSNYVHLLHLIIFKNNFKKIRLKTKDNIFNFFFKKILEKYNANNIFLCYEKNNKKAQNFYLRNNFKTYFQNEIIVFVTKKIR